MKLCNMVEQISFNSFKRDTMLCFKINNYTLIYLIQLWTPLTVIETSINLYKKLNSE